MYNMHANIYIYMYTHIYNFFCTSHVMYRDVLYNEALLLGFSMPLRKINNRLHITAPRPEQHSWPGGSSSELSSIDQKLV